MHRRFTNLLLVALVYQGSGTPSPVLTAHWTIHLVLLWSSQSQNGRDLYSSNGFANAHSYSHTSNWSELKYYWLVILPMNPLQLIWLDELFDKTDIFLHPNVRKRRWERYYWKAHLFYYARSKIWSRLRGFMAVKSSKLCRGCPSKIEEVCSD